MIRKLFTPIVILSFSVIVSGCAFVTETSKTIWGSSTRALENARDEAISKSFVCSLDECFEMVLSLGEVQVEIEQIEDEAGQAETKETITRPKFYNVFLKNRVKRHIVVIGVPGSVNTTEVGIFFDKNDDSSVKMEISSLSRHAKRRVAKDVFAELGQHFSEAQ